MEQPKPKTKLILLESDAAEAARFTRVASRLYDVVLERDVKQALSVATSDPMVNVFVAGSCGVPATVVLERVKSARPDVLRVSLTDPLQLGSLIEGLHSGMIERTIQKPVGPEEVLIAIMPRVISSAAPRPAQLERQVR